jgi:uncharacterized radical SAM superfamily Fe-S cluster-containing enzyme
MHEESDHQVDDRISSLCPQCLASIPGTVRETASGVFMEKTCPEHGRFSSLIASDLSLYNALRETPRKITRPSQAGTRILNGCPDDCGLCTSHEQHTCLAILEIVSYCDLQCPVCLAGAPVTGRCIEASVLKSALRRLVSSEGGTAPLQIGGGEPTLHPDLVSIVNEIAALGFPRIEMDSNGLALASDPDLSGRLREAGLTSVYLQMDGLDREVSRIIRGRDLVEEKLRSVENCQRAGLEVILSVTVVPDVNDGHLWKMIQFGVSRGLTGVNFQPVALSGRYPKHLANSRKRLTPGHFMREMERQSGGRLLASDFTPIPCPDPRCGLMSYVLIQGEKLTPLSRVMAQERLADLVADQSDWNKVIQQMACDSFDGCTCKRPQEAIPDLGTLLVDTDFFSIGYHGMMDAYSFDRERAARCCVHELTWDGRLIPFCLYNIKYRDSRYGARE